MYYSDNARLFNGSGIPPHLCLSLNMDTYHFCLLGGCDGYPQDMTATVAPMATALDDSQLIGVFSPYNVCLVMSGEKRRINSTPQYLGGVQ
jgi:hypothetical protein